jgi:hypothetical protein
VVSEAAHERRQVTGASGLRAGEAFPRNPPPRHVSPTADEIAAARQAWETHIPSLFHRECLAVGCGAEWPCRPCQHAVWVLDRAGLIDVNGQLRPLAE